MANFERDGSSRRKPGEGKYSGVSGLTGARICSVRVSGEQFNFLRTAALISDEKRPWATLFAKLLVDIRVKS